MTCPRCYACERSTQPRNSRQEDRLLSGRGAESFCARTSEVHGSIGKQAQAVGRGDGGRRCNAGTVTGPYWARPDGPFIKVSFLDAAGSICGARVWEYSYIIIYFYVCIAYINSIAMNVSSATPRFPGVRVSGRWNASSRCILETPLRY